MLPDTGVGNDILDMKSKAQAIRQSNMWNGKTKHSTYWIVLFFIYTVLYIF